MATPIVVRDSGIPGSQASKEASSRSLQSKIDSRLSKELVIAFSGPAGVAIGNTTKNFEQQLKGAGYTTVVIKLSDQIKERFKLFKASKPGDVPADLASVDPETLRGVDRYEKLQTIGNFLRQTFEHNILAQIAIEEILLHRVEAASSEFEDKKKAGKLPPGADDVSAYAIEHYVPPKTAYLIDQLKNPAEVELLRDVYGDLFYLVGSLCPEQERRQNLINAGMQPGEAASVMDRDRRENEESGQQLEKTLQLSDFFIGNAQTNQQQLEKQIKRFIEIIHRTRVFTPTADEYGMYVAHSAALRSACLSRQVGAAIADGQGQVLSTGCNDVPKFDGGLYSSNDSKDLRCYNSGGKCYNDDFKKRLIRIKLQEILERKQIPGAADIAEEMFRSTRLKHLIEFSRSIHAEMDALLGIARKGGVSTRGCTLYTTTYPCHSCAGHIIAAGIYRVVYIEPYEKSLAVDLHGDAISSESESDDHVVFTHFVGIAPRRYQDFFLSNEERKDKNGIAVTKTDFTLKPKIHQYLDSYRNMEARVFEHLKATGLANE